MTIRIWSAENGSCPRVLTGHKRGQRFYKILDFDSSIFLDVAKYVT